MIGGRWHERGRADAASRLMVRHATSGARVGVFARRLGAALPAAVSGDDWLVADARVPERRPAPSGRIALAGSSRAA
jgi:hypothetical protein